ncbi:ABC transporter permease [Alcaligenes sp. SDU_A2]|uniref:ABC transporter permease n=1 Tax=Alcaligenes sp. SDU_A2 TaxID=3136634 RepID=UPI002BBA2BEB|nr:ABC transporter permease [Alcaligenes sp.]HRL27982.1 ABC transporter permease [Alcaligenes sp.]
MSSTLRSLAWGVGGLTAGVLLWWLAIAASDSTLMQQFGPGPALASLIDMLGWSDTWLHVGASLQRIAVGLAISLGVGVPAGLLLGLSSRAHAALTPLFQFLRMISPLSWMPIAVMAFGIGDAPIYFLLGVAGVWPVLLNTASGVRHLNPRWLMLGRSLAATRLETLLYLVLPGIVGSVLTGSRLAIGVLWIVLVPCEMLGVSAGLGYLVLDTRDRMAYSELMAVIVLIGLIGYVLDSLLRSLFAVAGQK